MNNSRIMIGLLFAALFSIAPAVFGQTAIIVYADDITEVTLTRSGRGAAAPVAQIGASIDVNTTIETGATGLELQLQPSGSIVRIAEDTVFAIESMNRQANGTDHAFRLDTGKIRTVVATLRGDDRFTVRTPTAVAGVRGTDFVNRVIPGQTDWVCVQEGAVTFTRRSDDTSILVRAGAFADAIGDTFAPEAIGPEQLQELFSDVQFVELDPGQV